jgi:CheY-like chemotaxis protein
MEQPYLIKNILLADDDRDHAALFRHILQKERPGVEVHAVHDGDELLRYLRLYPVDLLFLDLNMPCKNGYECLREIRNDPSKQDLPIVMYSSSAYLTDIQKSFVNRADFYLVKPFNTDHLRTALQKILEVDWRDEHPLKQHYFMNNRFVPYTPTE